MARVMINLEEEERDALVLLAQREKRDPRRQAAMIIRRTLEEHGLLDVQQPSLVVPAREAAV